MKRISAPPSLMSVAQVWRNKLAGASFSQSRRRSRNRARAASAVPLRTRGPRRQKDNPLVRRERERRPPFLRGNAAPSRTRAPPSGSFGPFSLCLADQHRAALGVEVVELQSEQLLPLVPSAIHRIRSAERFPFRSLDVSVVFDVMTHDSISFSPWVTPTFDRSTRQAERS